jgi:hypothetical protein
VLLPQDEPGVKEEAGVKDEPDVKDEPEVKAEGVEAEPGEQPTDHAMDIEVPAKVHVHSTAQHNTAQQVQHSNAA